MIKTILSSLFLVCLLVPQFLFSQSGNAMLGSAFGKKRKVAADVSGHCCQNDSTLTTVPIQKDGKIISAHNPARIIV